MLGQTYNVMPVPPDPDHTTYANFGPLRVGVEYRVVDPEALADAYEGDDLAEIEEHSPEGGFFDEGLSIHIESVADDHEYIRFDAFDDEPHYHYVDWDGGNQRVPLALMFWLGKEKIDSGAFYVPDSPYFTSVFLGDRAQEGKPYSGRYYKKGGRYFCQPCRTPEGDTVVTEFDLEKAFERSFDEP